MKVIEFIKQMNKKQLVKVQRLLELKRYYLSMYRVYMIELYDKGYISDPTRFDKKVVYANIMDMKIMEMFSITGNLVLSSNQVKYAMYCNKDSEKSEFLSILYNVLRYKEYSEEIDNIYEEFHYEESDRQKISFNLKLTGAKLNSKLGFNLTRGGLACLLQSSDSVEVVNINDFFWILAMQQLEIPKDEWNLDGLFSSKLSHKEEVECIKLLLEGDVKLTGKYGKVLTDWLYNHKWANKGMTNLNKGLYDYLYIVYSDEILAELSQVLNFYNDSNRRILAVVEGEIFIEKPICTYNIPIGCFSVMSGEDDELFFDGEVLNGYTGEAYPATYLLQEGIKFVGCPIKLNTSYKDTNLFFDLEQVDIKTDSWFKDNEVLLEFEEIYIESTFKEGTLEDKIFNIYLESLNGKLVGRISSDYSLSDIESAMKNVMRRLQ